ncbi:hypothetical protein C7974DRAFT_292035, partial [Boeremia exigua]|uniref:uncharacterized protein n=1 Tax=Boeremia exigua TaxID=749465 RepID=UPI001E8E9870
SPAWISELNKVVEFDPCTLNIKVEPNVTMLDLVETTMQFGFLPAVVADCRDTTVASAFAAQSSASSSFAFGTFDDTVVEIEMILHDREIVCVRPDKPWNRDQFYGSAYPTFRSGVITMFEIRLVVSGPCVEL